MNSIQIRCFIEVAKCLNFTEAAEKLYITQPAISRNISMLEQEWNIKLFTRENKRKETALTTAGKVMADGLEGMIQEFDGLLKQAHQLDKGKAGLLRIGLLDGECIDDYIFNALNLIQISYPDVNTSLHRGCYGEIISWIENDKIDCCVFPEFEAVNREWLKWTVLYSLDSLLILSKKHPLAQGEACSLIDCAQSTFISLQKYESPIAFNYLVEECEKSGFHPQVTLVPNVKEQQLLLETGKGIMIGSQNNMFVGLKHMSSILLKDLKPINQVLAWKKNHNNPCIKIFYDLIK